MGFFDSLKSSWRDVQRIFNEKKQLLSISILNTMASRLYTINEAMHRKHSTHPSNPCQAFNELFSGRLKSPIIQASHENLS